MPIFLYSIYGIPATHGKPSGAISAPRIRTSEPRATEAERVHLTAMPPGRPVRYFLHFLFLVWQHICWITFWFLSLSQWFVRVYYLISTYFHNKIWDKQAFSVSVMISWTGVRLCLVFAAGGGVRGFMVCSVLALISLVCLGFPRNSFLNRICVLQLCFHPVFVSWSPADMVSGIWNGKCPHLLRWNLQCFDGKESLDRELQNRILALIFPPLVSERNLKWLQVSVCTLPNQRRLCTLVFFEEWSMLQTKCLLCIWECLPPFPAWSKRHFFSDLHYEDQVRSAEGNMNFASPYDCPNPEFLTLKIIHTMSPTIHPLQFTWS